VPRYVSSRVPDIKAIACVFIASGTRIATSSLLLMIINTYSWIETSTAIVPLLLWKSII
jgi:hypothetical protein